MEFEDITKKIYQREFLQCPNCLKGAVHALSECIEKSSNGVVSFLCSRKMCSEIPAQGALSTVEDFVRME